MVIITCLFAALISCRKEANTLDSGTITGQDPRMCMCCGGWFIVIRDTTWRFDQVPSDCTIDFATATYPMNVKLEWKKKDTVCLGDEIKVIRMVTD